MDSAIAKVLFGKDAVSAVIVEEFPDEILASLCAQGVSMDDWDYAVIASPDVIQETGNIGVEQWEAKTWTFDRILVGCCCNYWYKITLNGQEYALGVAYHA